MTNIPTRVSKLISEKYSQVNNSFYRKIKPEPEDRIEVEIGDSKQPDFKPQFKVMRWDNEVNFSIRATEHPAARVETDNDIVKYITPDYEVHQYEKPEAGEDGGFEFEWLLPRKPSTNVLSATIATKELDFFYQPPLTKEEIKEGSQRPENVEGSYAVYHKTKKNNKVGGKHYKTGKAFHIYRPKAIDVEGNEAWCELNIDEQHGLLTVTVPQEFLDRAIYPVLVDPTFGYTSAGASGRRHDEKLNATQFDISENGDVSSMSVFINVDVGTTSDGRMGIYDTSGNLLGDTNSYDVTSASDPETVNVTSTISLTTGTYWLADISRTVTGSGWTTIKYDMFTSLVSAEKTTSGITLPDPLGSYTAQNDRRYSIYATYTAGGGSTDITVSASTQSATFSVNAPTVSTSRNVTITPAVLSLTTSLQSPSVTTVRNVSISPNSLGVTTSLQQPAVSAIKNVSLAPDTVSSSFSIPTVSVTAGSDVTVTPSVLGLTNTLLDPTVTAIRNVSLSPTALEITGNLLDPTIATEKSVVISPDVITSTSDLLTPTITAVQNVSLSPDVLSASFEILSAQVGHDFSKNQSLLFVNGASILQIGAGRISTWGSTTRPTGQLGMIGLNLDTGSLEVYDGDSWVSVALS